MNWACRSSRVHMNDCTVPGTKRRCRATKKAKASKQQDATYLQPIHTPSERREACKALLSAHAKHAPLRRGTVWARAPSLAVLNVRRCDRCTRTALAHGIHWHPSSPLRCFPPWCPALALREQTCVSLCLSHDCDFSACLSAVARRRRPQYASFPSIPARFTAT